jgi:Superfamily I DNA and RNA helicases
MPKQQHPDTYTECGYIENTYSENENPTKKYSEYRPSENKPSEDKHYEDKPSESSSVENKSSETSDKAVSFPDEIEYLTIINKKLETAYEKAAADVVQIDQDYKDVKRYMAEYRGEIDPHEMFQNELSLRQIDHVGAFSVGVRDKIAKLKKTPYFARIDFQPDNDSVAEKHYIGCFSFYHENELLISDWRSPVASMFYDYEIGAAGYDAPIGRITGNLVRKRQFKIKEGKLIFTLESSVNIQDDILQQELSSSSDEKMKSIIATIQKEQNCIIRNEKAGTMIIQGVAGSGKTSIALHRIAFLLYRFKNKLSSKNILILSPNKVFADYISDVLPELGEEPLYELSFYDLAHVQLEGIIDFEPDKDPFEANDAKWAERVQFKSTLDFVRKMDLFLDKMPEMIFEAALYSYKNISIDAEWIKNRFNAYSADPVKVRLKKISGDILELLRTDYYTQNDLPKTGAILKSLHTMLKVKSTLNLYQSFYQYLGISDLFILPAKKTLEWADVYPFLYFHAAFEGLKKSDIIHHLVIDEMQDYTPMQYVVLNLLFPCEKTILGDFGQFVNPNHQNTLEDILQLYSKAEFVELTKSYRSSYEIIKFANRIQRVDKLEPIERHGEEPFTFFCRNKQDELAKIRKLIAVYEKSGYTSLGIIVKTNHDAKVLSDILSQFHIVHLLSPESNHFTNGISVTSVQMSKGLEFDEVILSDVDRFTYCSQYDRSLLYIACTRAMHKLSLLYTGNPSNLINFSDT